MSDHVLTCRLDTSNLWKAQTIFLRYSNTVPAFAVNRTALFCIRDAQKNTPAVSPGRVNSDLNVSTSPMVTKKGLLSRDKSKQNSVVTFQNRTPDEDDVSAMNTAQRIVLARMHPTSKYSLETGNRWPVPMPDISSGRRDKSSLFWAYVAEVAERMVKARRSSVSFLRASWTTIIYQLLPNVPTNYRGGFGGMESNSFSKDLLTGEVTPARTNQPMPVCIVSNTIGMKGVTPELAANYNEAGHRILGPILQASINKEYDSKMAEAARRGWLDEQQNLAATGFTVT
jgi:hypothetical protein